MSGSILFLPKGRDVTKLNQSDKIRTRIVMCVLNLESGIRFAQFIQKLQILNPLLCSLFFTSCLEEILMNSLWKNPKNLFFQGISPLILSFVSLFISASNQWYFVLLIPLQEKAMKHWGHRNRDLPYINQLYVTFLRLPSVQDKHKQIMSKMS